MARHQSQELEDSFELIDRKEAEGCLGKPESPGPVKEQTPSNDLETPQALILKLQRDIESLKREREEEKELNRVQTPSNDLETPQALVLKLQRDIESLKREREEEKVLNQVQSEVYREDFLKERKDREEAVKRYVALKDEMKLFQKQLDEWRALPGGAGGVARKETELVEVGGQSCDVREQWALKSRELLAARDEIAKVEGELQMEKARVATLQAELEAAKEEIAVKVAQVKQYQKQVEAYKGQVGILHIKTQEAEREAIDASETLIIEILTPVGGTPGGGTPVGGVTECPSSLSVLDAIVPFPSPTPPPPPSTRTSPLAPSKDMPQKEAIVTSTCEPDPPTRCPDHSEEHAHPPPLLPPMSCPKGSDTAGTRSSLDHGGGASRAPPSSDGGGGDSEGSKEDLPPPIFHHPFQQMHPPVVSRVGKSGQERSCPPSRLGALELCGVNHVTPPVNHVTYPMNHVTPPVNHVTPPVNHATPPVNHVTYPMNHVTPPVNHVTPPVDHVTPPVNHVTYPMNHVTPPAYKRAVSHPSGDPPSSVSNQALSINIDGDIKRVAASVQRDTAGCGGVEEEEADTPAPLDPNLKCPICGRMFKKGRIQQYKRHVQTCNNRGV